jgi:S-methylmethionine-dependent homocysteine/selenocysteine methylase/SAM-dependent methyltransferase
VTVSCRFCPDRSGLTIKAWCYTGKALSESSRLPLEIARIAEPIESQKMKQEIQSPYERILKKFERDECVILDGAIATELQRQGARDFRLSDTDHWGFEALQHAPLSVSAVHKSYIEVGCDVITTNTYGILDAPSGGGDLKSQLSKPSHWMDMARKSILLARDAIESSGKSGECAVAFSIGGDILDEQHFKTIELLLRVFAETPPDLVLLETVVMMTDNYTKRAVALLIEAGYPVWLSFRRCQHGVCGIHGQLWGGPEGDYFGRLAGEMEDIGVGAILTNCLPASRVSGTIPWLRDFTKLPLGVYPNLGRYVDPEWQFDDSVGPEDFADMALIWRAEGAQILGGCCGVEPAHMAALVEAVKSTKPCGPIGQTSAVSGLRPLAERLYETEETIEIVPWADQKGRDLFPLPVPEMNIEPGVFVPTQGSYLTWKYLFNQDVGDKMRCLDVGCGCGLLAIQLALNGASEVTALDIQKEAVANTLTNAFRNGVHEKIKEQVTDLYTFVPDNKYDVIVASLYQMPTSPLGKLSGHRPVDFWGRSLVDHFISILPELLEEDGKAYIMQVSLLGQNQTQRLIQKAGLQSRVVDFNMVQFNSTFDENLEQIERVEKKSDAYHFVYRDSHVMVMYLIEVTHVSPPVVVRPME